MQTKLYGILNRIKNIEAKKNRLTKTTEAGKTDTSTARNRKGNKKMTTSLKVGVHAVVLEDVRFGGYDPVLKAGDKVFVSCVAPLTVSTEEGTQVRVSAHLLKTSRGRPKHVESIDKIIH